MEKVLKESVRKLSFKLNNLSFDIGCDRKASIKGFERMEGKSTEKRSNGF